VNGCEIWKFDHFGAKLTRWNSGGDGSDGEGRLLVAGWMDGTSTMEQRLAARRGWTVQIGVRAEAVESSYMCRLSSA
jgi:hypothetical protein